MDETQYQEHLLIGKARDYAIECHESTNHLYDGNPYSLHLRIGEKVVQRFIHLLPAEIRPHALSAWWLHDTIEDCRQTYNDIKKITCREVADIVYAVSNEKGRNRKERASNKYYDDMINVPGAVFVKLCDRIANIKYGAMMESPMFEMYKSEQDVFEKKLFHVDYVKIWQHIREILNNETFSPTTTIK